MSFSDTVVEAIEGLILRRLSEVNTSMPGKVISASGGKADVVPLIKQLVPKPDGTFVEETLPVIRNAQVCYSGSGGVEFTYPLVKGSMVILLISQVSLDRWKSSLTPTEVAIPDDDRRFDLSDTIVIPGLRTFATPSKQIHDTDAVIAAPGLRLGDVSAIDGVVRLSDLTALRTAMKVALLSGPLAGDGGAVLLGKIIDAWTPSASDKVKSE